MNIPTASRMMPRQALIVTAFAALTATPVFAADLTWDGGGGGFLAWNDMLNWDPDDVPDDGDNLLFDLPAGTDTTVLIGSPSDGNNIDILGGGWSFLGAGGATLDTEGVISIGDALAGDIAGGASVTVGSGVSTWDNLGDLVVGHVGFGSMRLEAAVDLFADEIFVGSGATGELTLTGAGTSATARRNANVGVIEIGRLGGTGTLNVLDDADLLTASTGANDIRIGTGAGSTGTLHVDGAGSFAETEDLYVGFDGGAGFLNITGGGVINLTDGPGSPDFVMAFGDAGSTGTAIVAGANSRIEARVGIIGAAGTAMMTVRDGGRLATRGADGDLLVGNEATADGTLEIYGAGAEVFVDRDLRIGVAGDGDVLVGRTDGPNVQTFGGGTLNVDGNILIGDGSGNANDNRLIIDGPGAFAEAQERIVVGDNGNGVMSVLGGGQALMSFLRVGEIAGSSGTLVVEGDGSLLDTTIGSGSNAIVGTNGVGFAEVRDGATMTANALWIGYQGNADGTIIVDDATLIAGEDNRVGANLFVGGRTDGSGGTGHLTIRNGGLVRSLVDTDIGGNAAATGSILVTGAGSYLDTSDNAPNTAPDDIISVGVAGATASLDVLAGGQVDAEAIRIGDGGGTNTADMLVDGAGSVVNIDNYLIVGEDRRGTLTVSNGGTVNVANSADPAAGNNRLTLGVAGGTDGSALTITGAGSTLTMFGNDLVRLGGAGAGSAVSPLVLNVLDGGQFLAQPATAGATVAGFRTSDGTGSHTEVNVDGAGSRIEARFFEVMDSPDTVAEVNVTNGGVIDVHDFAEIGARNTGTARLLVSGVNSQFNTGTDPEAAGPGDLSIGATAGATNAFMTISDGGTVHTPGRGFIARFTNDSGTVTVATGGTWDVAQDLFMAGTEVINSDSGTSRAGQAVLNVQSGGTVDVEGTLFIKERGTVNMNGGVLKVDDIGFIDFNVTAGVPTLNFNSGTVRFANPNGKTLDAGNLQTILDPAATLVAGQTLAVDGPADLQTPLRINGGTFRVGEIAPADFMNLLDFDSGTFELTDANFEVGLSVNAYGNVLTFDADQTLAVPNHTVIVTPGATLTVVGGYAPASTINQSNLTFIQPSGTKIVPGDFLTTDGSATTVVGNVQFDGPVSGGGDFFGPGTTTFAGGYTPGSSPDVIGFEGNVAFATANTLIMEIGGTALGTYDRLEIAGLLTAG